MGCNFSALVLTSANCLRIECPSQMYKGNKVVCTLVYPCLIVFHYNAWWHRGYDKQREDVRNTALGLYILPRNIASVCIAGRSNNSIIERLPPPTQAQFTIPLGSLYSRRQRWKLIYTHMLKREVVGNNARERARAGGRGRPRNFVGTRNLDEIAEITSAPASIRWGGREMERRQGRYVHMNSSFIHRNQRSLSGRRLEAGYNVSFAQYYVH